MTDLAERTESSSGGENEQPVKVKCFAAPGLWGAMNSLGAGGAQSPYLVNTANALTFCLMVVSCWFTSSIVKYIGIKGALFVGTIGYAPYSAGLYLNNRYGVEWLVILGAALCGVSAGIFWAAEAAIAIAYPEPRNRSRIVAYWLTWTKIGQILGGAVNLGLNADRNQAGKVSYNVYLIFIALQASGTLVALLLNDPSKVQRPNGTPVQLTIFENPWNELKATTKTFFTRKFLLIIFWIGQGVYSEAVFFTYNSLWFSGAWWLWLTINVTEYNRTQPLFDWVDPGFGRAFGVFVFLVAGFQLNYNFSYFIIGQISSSPQETIRLAALLRGTESAWQALSYGLNAIPIIASIGGPYINFGLWGAAIIPVWFVIKDFGIPKKTDEESPSIETHGDLQKGGASD
ncbi:hypothetical protein ABKA04_001302 [Annulohypoxylon sp. FPYF3050]